MEIPDAELRKNEKFYIMDNLFIKKDVAKNWTQTDWSRERGAAKTLLSKYQDFDFFYSLINIQNKFNSLLGLLSKKFHDLDKEYFNFKLDKCKKIEYTLSDSPVIEIEQIEKKPKNLMEFLDN